MGKKKGKGKEKKEPPVTDGLMPIDMSRKQMLGHVPRLKEEIEREKEERNYFMLEREKLYQRWQLYMEQIAIEKAKVQALKSHLDDRKKDQFDEDKLQNSKLRFLKAEQTRKLGQLRLLHLQQMAQVQDEAWMVHMLIKEELMNKKREIRRAQMAFYQLIRGLHWKHAKQVSDLREQFAQEIRRLETAADRNLFEKNEMAEERQAKELKQLAHSKEDQISYLIEDHAWQIDQMKAFFQELLKVSLDIVNQMKMEVKQQTTAELMQRRDYDHFKHRYDVYVSPAVRWRVLMDEWTIAHQEDDLDDLVTTLTGKEEELEKRKYSLRMLEAANEALNQRIIIAEKERNCVKRQFHRAIVDSQRTASMKRFVQQVKKKAAGAEAEMYATLNKALEAKSKSDAFSLLLDKRDREMFDHLHDINEQSLEHDNTNRIFADTFVKNEISLEDLAFPIKSTGVKPVPQQDLDICISIEMEKRNKRHQMVEREAAGLQPIIEDEAEEGKAESQTQINPMSQTDEPSPPPLTENIEELDEVDELEWLPEEVDVLDIEDYYEEGDWEEEGGDESHSLEEEGASSREDEVEQASLVTGSQPEEEEEP